MFLQVSFFACIISHLTDENKKLSIFFRFRKKDFLLNAVKIDKGQETVSPYESSLLSEESLAKAVLFFLKCSDFF